MSEKNEWMISEMLEALDMNGKTRGLQISQLKRNYNSKDDPLPPCWLHSHHFTELFMMTEGEATFLYNFNENTIEKGDLLIVNPNIQHRELWKGVYGCYILCVTDLEINAAEKDFIVKTGDQFETYRFYLHKMMEESRNKPEGYREVVEHLFRSAMVTFRRNIKSSEAEVNVPVDPKAISNSVMIAKTYIENNYGKEVKINDLSQITYISQQHLIRKFKKTLGYTPGQYLIRVRIQVAAGYLISRDNSINQIAEMVGYNASQAFLYAFKKIIGMTPQEFRNKYRDDPKGGKKLAKFICFKSDKIVADPYSAE